MRWMWVVAWVVAACQSTDGAVRADAVAADAAVDRRLDGASLRDAAPGDASRRDAAPGDAAPGDAALLDAGRGDAAPRDAAPGDAAPRDAAPRDAAADAVRDAARDAMGPLDALARDAGVLDGAPDVGAPVPDAGRLGASFLALGDSYTIGTSVEPEERWPAQVVALLRAEGQVVADVRFLAQNGWTIFALNAALDRERPMGPFDLVTLLIGVNDQFFHETALAYERGFAGMLERAIELAGGDVCRVIVLSIPDYSVTPFGRRIDPERITREIAEFNRVNRAVTTARGVRYVDVTPSSLRAADDPGLLAADGLHPSGRMYAEWAGLVLPEARAVLGCPPRP